MTLATYSELTDAITGWLGGRTDLTSYYPDWIRLTETAVQNGSALTRPIRTRQMETRSSVTIDAEYETLPTDFLGFRSITLSTTPPVRLEYMTPQAVDGSWLSGTTGKPRAFTVVGSEVRFYPAPDTSYSGAYLYYAAIPALTSTNTSNWLLTTAPDVYLYGCLMKAAEFIRDPRAREWGAMFASAVNALRASEDEQSWSGGPLVMRSGINGG